MVITNPPFSLFREFVAWLVEGDVEFSVIGNMNAITYKEVFPLIRDNKLWLGVTRNGSGSMWFRIPDNAPFAKTGQKVDENGIRYQTVGSTAWFTNIEHGRRHEPMPLMTMEDNKRFNKDIFNRPQSYKKYDNYDAIEVPRISGIPSDYEGVMGVPITFLGRYCPEQFEILGATESEGTGFSGQLFDKTSKVKQATVNESKVYKRIFIKHRTHSDQE